jgi:hypothetical protein
MQTDGAVTHQVVEPDVEPDGRGDRYLVEHESDTTDCVPAVRRVEKQAVTTPVDETTIPSWH